MNRNENSLSCETKSNIIKFIRLSPLLPLLPIFSKFFPPSIPFLLSQSLSLPLPWPFSQLKVSSFSQQSSPSYRPPSLPLPPPSNSHMAISFPNSHMASWFSQDIADSSSSSDSLLEGGDEAHEQCVTAWLHEHRPVVHLHSLHLLTLYTISCTHTIKKAKYVHVVHIVSVTSNLEC